MTVGVNLVFTLVRSCLGILGDHKDRPYKV
jgi:hypothetical protein